MNYNVSSVTNSKSFRIYSALAGVYLIGSSICEIRKNRKNRENNNCTSILKMLGCNILKSLVWPVSLTWYGSKCIATNKSCRANSSGSCTNSNSDNNDSNNDSSGYSSYPN